MLTPDLRQEFCDWVLKGRWSFQMCLTGLQTVGLNRQVLNHAENDLKEKLLTEFKKATKQNANIFYKYLKPEIHQHVVKSSLHKETSWLLSEI